MVALKNDTKSDYTIRNVDKFLTVLDRKCNLDNPEEVKTFIANHNVSNNWIHYYMKPSALAENRSCVKPQKGENMNQCKNCMWYFLIQKLCYLKWQTKYANESCEDHTTDKGLNHKTELSRKIGCEC